MCVRKYIRMYLCEYVCVYTYVCIIYVYVCVYKYRSREVLGRIHACGTHTFPHIEHTRTSHTATCLFPPPLSAGAAFSALLPDGRAQGVPGVCEYLGEHTHYADQLVHPANGVAGMQKKN